MHPLTQRTRGIFCTRNDSSSLLLQPGSDQLFLRFALVVRGTERHVFPALLLDDWGRERKSLDLYRWIYEEGQRYPRAELFGFDGQGRKTQIFLRELEIHFHYPCYLYPDSEMPVQQGKLLDRLFFPDPEHDAPVEIEIPQDVTWPLRHADVRWQAVAPPALLELGWVMKPGFDGRSAET